MARRNAPRTSIAVAYLRASTDRQDLSPHAQREAITVWAKREGIDVVSWHADHGISGGSEIENRPGLIAAIGELRATGAATLLVAKRDRLARDPYIAATIDRAVEKCGARVVSADGIANGQDPASQFLRSILDAAAAYERQIIRARTKAALAVKKQRGERTGKIPYGFRLSDDGRSLVPHQGEQETIARAKALRAAGMKLREIAATLASEQRLSRSGRPYAIPQVFQMLRVSNPKEAA